jgi:hypothetical protein
LTRLRRGAADVPTSAARNALQEAKRIEIERRDRESREESRAKSEEELRVGLLHDADAQLTAIKAALRSAIEQDAAGCFASKVVAGDRAERQPG